MRPATQVNTGWSDRPVHWVTTQMVCGQQGGWRDHLLLAQGCLHTFTACACEEQRTLRRLLQEASASGASAGCSTACCLSPESPMPGRTRCSLGCEQVHGHEEHGLQTGLGAVPLGPACCLAEQEQQHVLLLLTSRAPGERSKLLQLLLPSACMRMCVFVSHAFLHVSGRTYSGRDCA